MTYPKVFSSTHLRNGGFTREILVTRCGEGLGVAIVLYRDGQLRHRSLFHTLALPMLEGPQVQTTGALGGMAAALVDREVNRQALMIA